MSQILAGLQHIVQIPCNNKLQWALFQNRKHSTHKSTPLHVKCDEAQFATGFLEYQKFMDYDNHLRLNLNFQLKFNKIPKKIPARCADVLFVIGQRECVIICYFY